MADYLMPSQIKITLTDKRNIFAVRNRMIEIPINFQNHNQDIIMCKKGCNEKVS